jgi:hypothetical protein
MLRSTGDWVVGIEKTDFRMLSIAMDENALELNAAVETVNLY